jgi:hypothetical protein
MFQKILPFLLIAIGLWYLPEIYLFTHNVSSAVYQETQNKTSFTVDFKVAKPVPYIPAKFSILGSGIDKVRVELNGVTDSFVLSNVTDEYGNTTLDYIPKGTYSVRIGREVSYSPTEIRTIEASGQSVFEDSELLNSSVTQIDVSKDMYVVSVVKE